MVGRELFNVIETLACSMARSPAFFEKLAADPDEGYELGEREDWDIQDFITEISEYMNCLYNETGVDTELRLMDLSNKEMLDINDDVKANARNWLDEVESYIRERASFFEDKLDSQLEDRVVKGVKLKLNFYLNTIEKLAKSTPEEYYGSRIAPSPYAYVRESDKTYKAKVGGKWLSGKKLVKDEKDADTFESKTEPTQRINQMKKDGKVNKNAKATVLEENELFESILAMDESIYDFGTQNRGMYRYAKRKHDETKAIRKVSKEPYWVHPEGVAKIIMEHGGSDIEIKAGMAHDLLEDTGCTFEDLREKFGDQVASIVKEVTNNKEEIEKLGKERYISEELVRLSPEALTVKLSDMLYNMKDSPTEKNYERMRNNVTYLMMNRELTGVHCELVEEILAV